MVPAVLASTLLLAFMGAVLIVVRRSTGPPPPEPRPSLTGQGRGRRATAEPRGWMLAMPIICFAIAIPILMPALFPALLLCTILLACVAAVLAPVAIAKDRMPIISSICFSMAIVIIIYWCADLLPTMFYPNGPLTQSGKFFIACLPVAAFVLLVLGLSALMESKSMTDEGRAEKKASPDPRDLE